MTWAKIDDQFYLSIKNATIDRDEQDLYVAGLVYCNGQLTDGFIPAIKLLQLYLWAKIPLGANAEANAEAIASRLVAHEFWELVDGGYQVHDFLDWNPSRNDVLTLREARSEAGRRGGERSGATRRAKAAANEANEAKRQAKAEAKSKQNRTPSPSPYPKEEEGGGAPASVALQAFAKARGPNINPTDPDYIAELVTLYGDAETAQAIIYCDKNKRDNFLRMNYIQTVLSSWQAEGTLGLHTPEYEAKKPPRNGHRAEPESNQDKLARVYAAMAAEEAAIGNVT